MPISVVEGVAGKFILYEGPSHSEAHPGGWAYNRVSTVGRILLLQFVLIVMPNMIEKEHIFLR